MVYNNMSRSRQNSDSKNSTTSTDSKISAGEKVLCYHGSLIYEAKCLKIRDSEDEVGKLEYFIHYAGWNKKWEEWVDENRVLKYTDENRAKQKNHNATEKSGGSGGGVAASANKKTPGRKSSTNDKDSGSSRPCSPAVSIKSNKSNQDTSRDDKDFELDFSKLKRKSILGKEKEKLKEKEKVKEKEKEKEKVKEKEKDKTKEKDKEKDKEEKDDLKDEESIKKEKEVPTKQVEEEKEEVAEVKYKLKFDIPEELIHSLTNDYQFVCKQQFLTTVPAELTIKDMFDDFLQSKDCEQVDTNCVGLTEFVTGLKEYVDSMLGAQLLYRFEKPQYKQIKEGFPNDPVHMLYGPVHMLRLLTRLEVAFNTLYLSAKRFKIIETYLQDLLKFLVENHDKYFNKDLYDAATPDYLRMVYK